MNASGNRLLEVSLSLEFSKKISFILVQGVRQCIFAVGNSTTPTSAV